MFRFNLQSWSSATAILLILLIAGSAEAGIKDDALVFYAMDDAALSPFAADSGMLVNNATLFSGAAFDGTAGKFGGGIYFDGTGYAKNTMDFATLTGDFTLAMWVKPDLELTSVSPELAFSFADTGGTNMTKYGPFMFWGGAGWGGDGLASQAQWNSGAWTVIRDTFPAVMPAGQWSHIASRYEFATATWDLWINNEIVESNGLGDQNKGLHNMIIGSFGSGTADGVAGVYDDVGYWDYALSTAEMNELTGIVPVVPPTRTHTWNKTASDDWNTGTNWSPATVPDSNTSVVAFGDDVNMSVAPVTVTTNLAVTVHAMLFGVDDHSTSGRNYTIAGSGSVTLEETLDDVNATVAPSILVEEGSHELTVALSLTDSANVEVESGSSLDLNNAVTLNGNSLTKTGGGTISINGTVTTGAGGSVAINGGVVNGTGTVDGNLTAAGATVAPGLGTGKLTITGDYLQTGGSLLMEINGTTAETDYDVLEVTGNLSIVGGGSIVVELGFAPSEGNVFDLLNWGTSDLNVTTPTVILPTIPAIDLDWDSSQLFVDGTLSVISLFPTMEWNTDSLGDWLADGNWIATAGGGTTAPNSNIQKAVFGDITSASRTVVVDSAVTIKAIVFNHNETYVIAGAGSVTLDADNDASTISVLDGDHQFQVVVNLNNATTVDTAASTSLAFNNALNLGGNTLTKTGDGTMNINNDLNTGGGAVVASAGVLGGVGTVGGDLTNNGATVAPGNSAGTLTVDGDYSQTAGALAVEIDGSAAGEFDVLAVTGDLTVSGGDLNVTFAALPGKFEILDVTGSSSVAFAAINNTGGLNVLFDDSLLDSTGELIVNSAELGDMNGDLLVNTADAALFVQALLDPASYDANNFFVVSADFNGDVDGSGTFDLGDLSSFSGLLGGPASASAVPEPSSILLLSLALCGVVLKRRNRS